MGAPILKTATNQLSGFPRTSLNHAQTSEKAAPNRRRDGNRVKFMYEIELSSPPETHGFFAAKKQRFIDAAKTLLDIANESADVFPPLKSCLGGISVLIKHYEVRLRRIAQDLTDTSVPGVQRR